MVQIQRTRTQADLALHQMARMLGGEVNETRRERRRRLKRMDGFAQPRNRALDLLIWLAIVLAIWATILVMSFLWLTGAIAEEAKPADIRVVSVHDGSSLTVRAEPTTAAGQRGALARDCRVAVRELRGDWALVYWPSHPDWPDIGWVCTDYLRQP